MFHFVLLSLVRRLWGHEVRDDVMDLTLGKLGGRPSSGLPFLLAL